MSSVGLVIWGIFIINFVAIQLAPHKLAQRKTNWLTIVLTRNRVIDGLASSSASRELSEARLAIHGCLESG